jgi:hypothetical protein
MAWVTPRTWNNEYITDAKLNEISSSLNALGGSVWTSYSPTWGATTTPPTLGSSIVSGAYRENGGSCEVEILITVGAGFVAGSGIYTFSLPVATSSAANQVLRGNGMFFDAAGPDYYAYNVYRTSGGSGLQVAMFANNTRVSSTVPVVPVAGDIISLVLEYRK